MDQAQQLVHPEAQSVYLAAEYEQALFFASLRLKNEDRFLPFLCRTHLEEIESAHPFSPVSQPYESPLRWLPVVPVLYYWQPRYQKDKDLDLRRRNNANNPLRQLRQPP
ncbi:hypothetical protein D3C78_1518630 [compost metagenome]